MQSMDISLVGKQNSELLKRCENSQMNRFMRQRVYMTAWIKEETMNKEYYRGEIFYIRNDNEYSGNVQGGG